MSALEITGLVASLVSLTVGVGAAGLSILFFRMANSADHRLSETTARIETHAGMLGKLTDLHMGKLIDYATQPRPEFQLIRDIIAGRIEALPPSPDTNVPDSNVSSTTARLLLQGAAFAIFTANEAAAGGGPEREGFARDFKKRARRMLEQVESKYFDHIDEVWREYLRRLKNMIADSSAEQLEPENQ